MSNTRRQYLASTAAPGLTVGGTSARAAGLLQGAAELAPRVPNILLLLPDQWRFDWMSGWRALPIRTPNLEQLARRGVRFNRAFSASPNGCYKVVTGFSEAANENDQRRSRYEPDILARPPLVFDLADDPLEIRSVTAHMPEAASAILDDPRAGTYRARNPITIFLTTVNYVTGLIFSHGLNPVVGDDLQRRKMTR